MTRPMRHLHGWAWTLMAVVLPILLATALAARRPTAPVNPKLSWERLR